MYVHLGTYDGNIISFEGQPDNMQLKNNFQASENSIRSLHRTGKYLVAGGFDEMIHIYDIRKNREDGQIDAQQGPLTCITSDGRVLITAGGQGTIKMWKVGKFDFLHQLKEHKSQIEHLAVDTSGRIMFSVGKDRKLVMWNLLKALRIFDRKLDFDVSKVLLSDDKEKIILLGEHEIRVVETQSNNEVSKLTFKERLQDIVLYLDRFLIASDDTGCVTVWSVGSFEHSLKFQAHDTRAKCISIVTLKQQDILLTVSSSGQLRTWDVLLLISELEGINQNYNLTDLKPINSLELGQRVICMIAGSLGTGPTVEEPDVEPHEKAVHKEVQAQTPANHKQKSIKKKKQQQQPEQQQISIPKKKKKIEKLKNKSSVSNASHNLKYSNIKKKSKHQRSQHQQ